MSCSGVGVRAGNPSPARAPQARDGGPGGAAVRWRCRACENWQLDKYAHHKQEKNVGWCFLFK